MAQYLGSGNKKLCGVVISSTNYYFFIISFDLSGHTNRSLAFSVVGHSPQQIALETMYFDILMYGTVLDWLETINSFLVGLAEPEW